jgi:hypothetical protein
MNCDQHDRRIEKRKVVNSIAARYITKTNNGAVMFPPEFNSKVNPVGGTCYLQK